jgi:glycosyltransferase involved in cell wall biosynthesis
MGNQTDGLIFVWDNEKLVGNCLVLARSLMSIGVQATIVTTGSRIFPAIQDAGLKHLPLQSFLEEAESEVGAWWHPVGDYDSASLLGVDLKDLTRYERLCKARGLVSGLKWPAPSTCVLRSAAVALRAWERVLDRLQPSLCAIWNGQVLIPKALHVLAQQRELPVFFLERGLLPERLVVDIKGVNEAGTLGGRSSSGIFSTPPEEEKQEEACAYIQEFRRKGCSVVNRGAVLSPLELRGRLHLGSELRVILIPNQLDHDTNIILHSPNFQTNESVVAAVLDAIRGIPNTFILVKTHPEDPTTVPATLKSLLGARGVIIDDVALDSLMSIADVVVVRNSTVGIEALLRDKPVVCLAASAYFRKGFTVDVLDPVDLPAAIRHALASSPGNHSQSPQFLQFVDYLLRSYHLILRSDQAAQSRNQRVLREKLASTQAGIQLSSISRSGSRRTPLIAAIIPTFNRPELLRECLTGFARQTLAPEQFEVVVLDDGSKVPVADVASSFKNQLNIVYHYQRNAGLAAARNAAIEKASAHLLALHDDDDVPCPDYLERCLRFHDAFPGEAAILLARVALSPRLARSPMTEWMFDGQNGIIGFPSPLRVHDYWWFFGGTSSCKRSLFRFGLYDPVFRFGFEDTELAIRLNAHVPLRVHYDPYAVSHLLRAPTFPWMFSRSYREGRSLKNLYDRHGEIALVGLGADALKADEIVAKLDPDIPHLLGIVAKLEAECARRGGRPEVWGEQGALLNRTFMACRRYARARGWLDQTRGLPEGAGLAEFDALVKANYEAPAHESCETDSHAPRVSVVIPCFKQAHFLRECVESVIAQSFRDWECIVVNDGSPDNTSEVVKSLMGAYPDKSIRLIEQENRGVSEARNEGIRAARAPYILPLDADDTIVPDMLLETSKVLDERPEVPMVFTDRVHFGLRTGAVSLLPYSLKNIMGQNMPSYCSLYRRAIWQAVGGYNPNMRAGYEDWDFWISCAEKGFIGYHLAVPLFRYRIQSESRDTGARRRDTELRCQIILNHASSYPLNAVVAADAVLARMKHGNVSVSLSVAEDPVATAVILCADAAPREIETTVRSLQEQLLKRVETVCVFGENVAEGALPPELSSGLRVLKGQANWNRAQMWNAGLRASKGAYVAFACAGDRYYPDHFSTVVAFLANTGHQAAYTNACLSGQDSKTQASKIQCAVCASEFNRTSLKERNVVPLSSCVLRRSAVENVQAFDEEVSEGEDWDLWRRMSQRCAFIHLPRVTVSINLESYPSLCPSGVDAAVATPPLPEPIVSVIIPCYGQARFLPNAVDSLAKQTYAQWECLVINDGSADDTSQKTRELAAQHPTRAIRLIEQQNAGLVGARNTGLRECVGEFMLFLDADDKLEPEFLERAVRTLIANPPVGFVYSDVRYFGAREEIEKRKDFEKQLFIRQNQASATSLFRRVAILQTGLPKSVMNHGLEDWEFWISMIEKGWQGLRIPEPLFCYRQYEKGSMLQELKADKKRFFAQVAKIVLLHPSLYPAQEIEWARQKLNESPEDRAVLEDWIRQHGVATPKAQAPCSDRVQPSEQLPPGSAWAERMRRDLIAEGCELEWRPDAAIDPGKCRSIGLILNGNEARARQVTLALGRLLASDRFTLKAFALEGWPNDLASAMERCGVAAFPLKGSVKEQADAIRTHRLDALLVYADLHTEGALPLACLAAHRLARKQILCSPCFLTSGLPSFDAFLSGELNESDESMKEFTENVLLLEGPALCYAPGDEKATVTCNREGLGIGAEEVVFVNASPAEQVSGLTQEAWARLLASVPGSLLALAPFVGREAKEDQVAAFVGGLEKVLAAHGVDDQRLVVLLKDLPTRADVRAFLEVGTVYLDVYPQADPQGLADALLAGLSAVAWQGKVSRSRAGAALLRDIKMDELVADTDDELIAKAKRLATDAKWRAEIKKRVVEAIKAKPRFLDPEWYAREVGSAVELLLNQDDGHARTVQKPGAMDTHTGKLNSDSHASGCVSVDGVSDNSARTAQTLRRCSGPLAAGLSMAPVEDPFWRGKRVMVYTDLPGIYGVGQYNHALLCDLARRGAEAFCVQTKDDNPLVRERETLGVKHLWLSYHTRREFERTFTDTKDPNKLFKKHKPDLILFSNCSVRSNLAAKRVAMQHNITFVITEGYVAVNLIAIPRWTKECDMQLATQYRAAKQVIAVSQDNLKLLRERHGMAGDKGVVIHNGCSVAYFAPRDESARKRLRAEFSIPEDAMLCFTAARLDPVKGYQYQLRALARLKESDVWPKLYFAWAGAGPAGADVQEGVRRLGVEDHVRILGERHDVIDWLSAADCFVLTSKAEGMPICIMEAMAKGLPVAATAVSGTPEELGDTGYLLPDPNKVPAEEVSGALVKALESWAQDGTGRQAEGARCHERAEGMFRVERMLIETRDCLAQVLSKA